MEALQSFGIQFNFTTMYKKPVDFTAHEESHGRLEVQLTEPYMPYTILVRKGLQFMTRVMNALQFMKRAICVLQYRAMYALQFKNSAMYCTVVYVLQL
jgi:hypothetical protein